MTKLSHYYAINWLKTSQDHFDLVFGVIKIFTMNKTQYIVCIKLILALKNKMNNIELLSDNIRDRLRYIEFSLLYKGEISRSDIMSKFNVKEATATRDIKSYSDLSNNKNCFFDSKTKKNRIKETFQQLYNLTDEEALFWLKQETYPNQSSFITYRFKRLSLPEQKALAPITTAIMNKLVVQIKYLSLNQGRETIRKIIPHSIMDDGLRTYIRAYDRVRENFITFSTSRIIESECLPEYQIEPIETQDKDTEWNEFIDLIIIPHPKLLHKNIIEYEYKMIRGELKCTVRKAVAGYFLFAWSVDCSIGDIYLDHQTHHLYLKNIEQLKNIESIKKLAPKKTFL